MERYCIGRRGLRLCSHTVEYCICASVAQSCPALCDPMDSHQASLLMEFSRPEYWRGLPFSSLGDLPDPRVKPGSPALQVDSLPYEPPGSHYSAIKRNKTVPCRDLDGPRDCHTE